MEENREQILADFQSCTGIEDVAECIMHLEATSWNLLDAINSVMPEESQTLPSEREAELPMEVVEESRLFSLGDKSEGHNKPNSDAQMPLHAPLNDANLASRLLNFCVHYKETMVPLEVPESETVAAIKTALHDELGVPPCRQELSGWKRNHITDDTILSSLQLPQFTNLMLLAPEHFNLTPTLTPESMSFSDRLNTKYRLHIIDTTTNKEYDLWFPGSKTVLEVKSGVRDVTNIPVRFQHWVGWPETLKDDNIKLASLDVKNPVLELILSREENALKKKQCIVDLTSSESDNEFEDASECFGVEDDMFQACSSSNRGLPLMPDDVDNEATAVQHFQTQFRNRYGSCSPAFQGTLADALMASCHKPAKERRPLAIYLHSDLSVLTNVFCTELLCKEAVVAYLSLNFVCWGWDLTYEANKTFLLAVVSQHLGLAAATAVKNIPQENLPAILIITKVRSTPEVLKLIPGNMGLDGLMTSLIHAVEVFNSEMTSEIWEEEERDAREKVKREQDAAYEASLLADRAKEEARRQEEVQKQKAEERILAEQVEQEQLRQHEEAMKDAICRSLASQLPPEPPVDSPIPLSHIRIRLPSGLFIARRFAADNPLALLLVFVASQGYPVKEYKVLASWPRRDLTTLDESKTLQELQLYPKETVTLEAR